MKNIEIESYAKVNLALDVLYKRRDKYHEINTVMQQISLKDLISIENTKGKDIIIESNRNDIPLNSSNLVYRAWDMMKERSGIQRAIKVKIHKNIPVAAGLAGGSSNAAATLKGLNELWDLKLSEDELKSIGLNIGADVPYCLMGGTAQGQGIGEVLTKVKSFKDKAMILFNPGIQVSTAHVYRDLKIDPHHRIDIEKIIKLIEKDDLINLSKNMENVMEKVVMKKHPIIKEAKKDMIQYGALGALMSGSGPTVFGLFEDLDRLDYCKGKMEDKYNSETVISCHTL